MQLRTNRKLKSPGLEDLGFEERPAKSHKKTYKSKVNNEKEHSADEVSSKFFLFSSKK